MFESQHDWFEHEVNFHRKLWECKLCSDRLLRSRPEHMNHLQDHHAATDESVDQQKVELWKKLRIDATECPLCSVFAGKLKAANDSQKCDVTLKQFQSHVGGHFEQLALAALPNDVDDVADIIESLSSDDEYSDDAAGVSTLTPPEPQQRTGSRFATEHDIERIPFLQELKLEAKELEDEEFSVKESGKDMKGKSTIAETPKAGEMARGPEPQLEAAVDDDQRPSASFQPPIPTPLSDVYRTGNRQIDEKELDFMNEGIMSRYIKDKRESADRLAAVAREVPDAETEFEELARDRRLDHYNHSYYPFSRKLELSEGQRKELDKILVEQGYSAGRQDAEGERKELLPNATQDAKVPIENTLAPEQSKKAAIKFKDAVGRKFNFPFHLCSTWEVSTEILPSTDISNTLKGMQDLIHQAFIHIDVIGSHVLEGHYDLVGPNGEIILPQAWEATIEPGLSITMHLWPASDTFIRL